MRCSQLLHGKQWFKRRENEPWASAECSGPQHDITKPKTNFAVTYKWSMTQMKVPDWLFVAIPRGAKPHGSKSFNPFTELGSMWHCARTKVCLRRSRRTLRLKKYDLYKKKQHYFYVHSAWSHFGNHRFCLAKNGLQGEDEPWACGRECSGPSMTYGAGKLFSVLERGLHNSKKGSQIYRLVWSHARFGRFFW